MQTKYLDELFGGIVASHEDNPCLMTGTSVFLKTECISAQVTVIVIRLICSPYSVPTGRGKGGVEPGGALREAELGRSNVAAML